MSILIFLKLIIFVILYVTYRLFFISVIINLYRFFFTKKPYAKQMRNNKHKDLK